MGETDVTTMIRTRPRTCGRCGAKVPDFAPDRLCLQCLFDSAYDPDQLQPSDPVSAGSLRRPRAALGNYELLGELGRGGQGTVYRARHRALGRTVALKVIPASGLAGRTAGDRFRLEAATASRLEHPNIVPIYEVGECDGFLYYSMRLMEGGPIDQAVSASASADDRSELIARLVLRVARAVHHAHQRGVLHRDLKPSNILLDAELEPRVTDFGLARWLEQESSLTLSQAIIGTAAYLSPEVARGGAAHATVASDVYGLGAVLYELLAGHPPFTGTSIADILRKVQEQEPPVPQSKIQNPKSKIPDLETICLKCLEKEPAKRYPTAQALADDLDRFLNNEPILARPITRVERVWRWCRRKPALAASLLLVLVLVLVLGIASPIAAYRIDTARQEAVQQAHNARQHLYFSQIHLAQKAIEANNPGHAAKLLERQIPTVEGVEDLRDWEWHYLWNQVQSDAAFELGRHDSLIRSIAISPNAELAASSDFAGGVAVWDLRNRQRLASFTEPDMVHQVLFLSDSILLTGGANGVLGFYDLNQAGFLRTLNLELPVRVLALSPDRTLLAAHCGDQEVPAITRVWRLGQPTAEEPAATLHELQTFQSPQAGWWWYLGGAVAFSPSGSEIAIGDVDNLIRIYSTATGNLRLTLGTETPNGGISTLAYAADGRSLVSQGMGGVISTEMQVWNVETGEVEATMPVQDRGIRELCLSPDGGWLVVADANQGIRLWSTSTWSLQQSYLGHRSEIQALAVAPFGTLALSGDTDGRILAWDYSQPTRRVQPLTLNDCRAFRFSRSGDLVATVEPAVNQGSAFRVAIRSGPDLGTGRELPANDQVLDVAFSPDGGQLVTLSPDSLQLWDLQSDRIVQRAELSASNTRILIGFSRDGQRVLLLESAWVTTTWNIATRRFQESWSVLATGFEPAAFDQRSVAFHAHSATLVVGFKGAAAVWDTDTSQLRGSLTGHSVWRVQPAISRDGRTIATLGEDGDRTVRLWNVPTMEQVGILETPPHLIHGPSFSPNGRRIAISHGRFGAAGIYDVATGIQLITLPAQPADIVRRTEWSPNGTTLALHGESTVVWSLAMDGSSSPDND